MGFISRRFLESSPQRNRGHEPAHVVFKAAEITGKWEREHGIKVELKAAGVNVTGKMYVSFTKEDVEAVLPIFLRESDLTNLTMGDPRRVALVEALSKLNYPELIRLLNEICAAKVENDPPSESSSATFASEPCLPDSYLQVLRQAATNKDKAAELDLCRALIAAALPIMADESHHQGLYLALWQAYSFETPPALDQQRQAGCDVVLKRKTALGNAYKLAYGYESRDKKILKIGAAQVIEEMQAAATLEELFKGLANLCKGEPFTAAPKARA